AVRSGGAPPHSYSCCAHLSCECSHHRILILDRDRINLEERDLRIASCAGLSEMWKSSWVSPPPERTSAIKAYLAFTSAARIKTMRPAPPGAAQGTAQALT